MRCIRKKALELHFSHYKNFLKILAGLDKETIVVTYEFKLNLEINRPEMLKSWRKTN
jgi:hypothetical protein